MAQKVATKQVQCFISDLEKGDPLPTRVYAIPLDSSNSGEYKRRQFKARRDKVETTMQKAEHWLIETALTRGPNNAFVENIYNIEGKLLKKVEDKGEAYYMLTHIKDVGWYDEMIDWLEGTFQLTEEEEKNLNGEPGAPLLPKKGS